MKIKFDTQTKTFSVVSRSFSDWDRIRDLVNSQLPNGIVRVRKVRGSDDGKSYQVIAEFKSGKTSKPITIPINGKSPLDNYNKATNSNIDDQSGSNDPKASQLVKMLKDPSTRSLVVRDKDTPSEILEILADDKYEGIRERVAAHPNTPTHVLEKLINDPNRHVVNELVNNPNVPSDILLQLYTSGKCSASSISRSPGVTPEVLSIISKSDSQDDQIAAASSIKTSKEDLLRLAGSADPRLCNPAKHTLMKVSLSQSGLTIDQFINKVNKYLATNGEGSLDCSAFVSLMHLAFPDAIIKSLPGHYYAILDDKVYSVDYRSGDHVEISDAYNSDYSQQSVKFIDDPNSSDNKYAGDPASGPVINLARTSDFNYDKVKEMQLI